MFPGTFLEVQELPPPAHKHTRMRIEEVPEGRSSLNEPFALGCEKAAQLRGPGSIPLLTCLRRDTKLQCWAIILVFHYKGSVIRSL